MIVINDAEISRRHARLTFQGGKYVLEDLGSTNGTFVNGQRLAGPRVLKAGEVVQFGEQIMLVFEVTSMDAGATMVSPRASAAVPSVPRPAVSAPPPPAVEYAGSIPASPAPVAAAPAKKMNLTPIIIGVVVFLILCCCISLFIWVDATPARRTLVHLPVQHYCPGVPGKFLPIAPDHFPEHQVPVNDQFTGTLYFKSRNTPLLARI